MNAISNDLECRESKLVFFSGFVFSAGQLTGLHFDPITKFCDNYFDALFVKDHFHDMQGIDFWVVILGKDNRNWLSEFEPLFPGVRSIGIGRNPLRYTPNLYVPVEEWLNGNKGTRNHINYFAGALDFAFETVINKAKKKPGRLIDEESTRKVLSDFTHQLRAIELPPMVDDKKYELELKRAKRRNLI